MISKNPLSIGKQQLADKLNISSKTLSRWLNIIEYDELQKLHYNKYDKIICKPVLDYMFPSGLDFEQ